jgi:hypothetical protein
MTGLSIQPVASDLVLKGSGGLVKSLVVLMMEEEQPEGLSARKLVVETVKHNVLTAYTLKDGLDLLHRFPNVDIIMVHARLLEQDPALLTQVRKMCPDKPIIFATPFATETRPEATFVVDSHRPHDLVKLLGSAEMQD